jgi:xylulokinase
MSYMGLDIGQTGCKAVVFDTGGKLISSAYREYGTKIPQDGWAELSSEEVRDSCFSVMGEANRECSRDPVQGLGISCQGEAFTPVDNRGRFLANAMITFDTRATRIASSWGEQFGKKKLYTITGHTPHPMYSLFKLLWIRENRRGVFTNTWKFLCFEDLIQYLLGIEPCISWPLAGRTMMFNIFNHQWDDGILQAVGIKKQNLANPVPSGTICGTVSPDIAKILGFLDKVHVVTAGHDQAVGALGAGVISSGKAMYAIGTSENISPSFPEPVTGDELYKNNLCTYDHALRGLYTTCAFSLTGGNLLKWFRDEWGGEEVLEAHKTGQDAYDLLIKKIGKNPTKLMVLPYFTPTGTPYYDTDVSGAVLGLRLSTRRGEVLRALLEGVAFEMRLNLSILESSGIIVDELRAIGGGAKNRVLLQLKSDVLGKPITRVEVTEAACLGAAMLACSAVTEEPIESLAAQWVKTGEMVRPDRDNAAIYAERFQLYKKMYPALRMLKI